MARRKNYVRKEVVQKARDAFWKRGYRALGIREIESLLCVGRFAIRTDFKGKEGLFLEALQSYRKEEETNIIAPLDAGEDLTVLEDLLTYFITPSEITYRKFGCLLVNTMVENATLQNPKIKKHTTEHFANIRTAIIRLVKRAKAKGAVREEVNVKAAGDFIIGSLMAIGLINRDAQDVTAATGYVKMVKATIASWRR